VLGPRDRLVGQLFIEGDLHLGGSVEGEVSATGDVEIADEARVKASVAGGDVSVRMAFILAPAIALFLTLISLNYVGERIRVRYDPGEVKLGRRRRRSRIGCGSRSRTCAPCSPPRAGRCSPSTASR
jgi:hypothetical protein